MAVQSADQTPIPCVPVTASPGLKQKKGVCEERTLRRSQPGQAWLELQSPNKCSDAEIGVLTTRETSCFSFGECRLKYE